MSEGASLPYGRGIYRRRILLRGSPGAVVADLEDDFHRFRVHLEHDSETIRVLRGEATRYPWTTCSGAIAPLAHLAGAPLSPRPTALADHTDPRSHCTHLFDLAALAVAHAAAGRDRRVYDIAVPDRIEKRTQPTLHRDGELLLSWSVDTHEILEPPPFSGMLMRGRQFLRWAEANLDTDLAEATLALRRACYISGGRAHDLDGTPVASVYLPLTRGSCWTFQPENAPHGARVKGTTREFTHRPEALLADTA